MRQIVKTGAFLPFFGQEDRGSERYKVGIISEAFQVFQFLICLFFILAGTELIIFNETLVGVFSKIVLSPGSSGLDTPIVLTILFTDGFSFSVTSTS